MTIKEKQNSGKKGILKTTFSFRGSLLGQIIQHLVGLHSLKGKEQLKVFEMLKILGIEHPIPKVLSSLKHPEMITGCPYIWVPK